MGGRTPHSGGTDPPQGGGASGRGPRRQPAAEPGTCRVRDRAFAASLQALLSRAPRVNNGSSARQRQSCGATAGGTCVTRRSQPRAAGGRGGTGRGAHRATPWGERPRACRAGGRQQGRPRQASCGVRACKRACVRASERACVRACERACGRACGRAGGRVVGRVAQREGAASSWGAAGGGQGEAWEVPRAARAALERKSRAGARAPKPTRARQGAAGGRSPSLGPPSHSPPAPPQSHRRVAAQRPR